ncbi:MAG: TauD/TfdA family dioxygenase [Caulobacteraceae bacterium]|nr:TauD/TfdA family dioxygenase [Caulobacteraceae bacterium]
MLEIKPLRPFGAEIAFGGADILDAAWRRDLVGAMHERDLLVARSIDLSPEAQIALMEIFGAVASDRHHNISTDPEAGVLGVDGLSFHADTFFAEIPYKYISLYAADVVDGASSTLFAGTARVLDHLPVQLWPLIASLEVRNTFLGKKGARAMDDQADNPGVWRPLVWSAPRSGKRLLSASESHSIGLRGLDEAEADQLLETLFSLLYQASNVYEHPWRRGDLVMWNNFTLQHGRRRVADVGRRTLRRVTVADKLAHEQYPVLKLERFAKGHPRRATAPVGQAL